VKKQVIIINGAGGVGKDTLISSAAQVFKVRNVSSVELVKQAALVGGWNGEKDARGRELLIALKNAFVIYDDLPMKYCLEQYKEFQSSDEQIMFVHIREPQEIARFKEKAGAKTLLVVRRDQKKWGQNIDDMCDCYNYDIIFNNDLSVEDSGKRFVEILRAL